MLVPGPRPQGIALPDPDAGGMAPAFAAALSPELFARNLVVLAGIYLLINRFLFTYGVSGHLNTMRSRGEIE